MVSAAVIVGVAAAVPFFAMAAVAVAWQPRPVAVPELARAVSCPRVRARLGLVA